MLSVLGEEDPHYIDNIAVHVRLAPHTLQPNRPHDYLSELPGTILQKILSQVNRFDLLRLARMNNRLNAEAQYSHQLRQTRFNKFEMQVMREAKLVFTNSHEQTHQLIDFIKCLRGNLTTVQFNLTKPMRGSMNRRWLSLLRNCARYLAPTTRLQLFVLKYFDFSIMNKPFYRPFTPFLPIFRYLTTLQLYQVICNDQQLALVMKSTNTIKSIDLMHMNHITGKFLLAHTCQLISLSIYKCANLFASRYQIAFILHNRQLRAFTWTKSPGIDTFHFLLIAKYWKKLELFDFDMHNQRSESAFWYEQPDLCALDKLRSLRKLYLRFDRRFYFISMARPIRLIVDQNLLVELTMDNVLLVNELLSALARAINLRSLMLTNLTPTSWEPNLPYSEYYYPLCGQPILDLAINLKHLESFGMTFTSALQLRPKFLVHFIKRAAKLATIYLAQKDKLFSIRLFEDLIPICMCRGHGVRLLILVADLHEDDLDECREIVHFHKAGKAINVRPWDK